ncbi:MAG TPA: SAM-dependent methyltransferase [Actinomycetota bacterium]|nr:SAM-dependent methyltransferase [Actinomycetota bacterium]
MNELERLISTRIEEGGPMPFGAYMQLALYHPRLGYYGGGRARTGWTGHFVTSPELDPGFGALWARAIEQLWRAAGAPSRWTLVEVGPGEGGLAAGITDSLSPDLAPCLHYVLVERTVEARTRQQARLEASPVSVAWVESLDDLDAINGCVVAHELLDNLPVHLVQRTGDALEELCVTSSGNDLELIALPLHGRELHDYLDRCGVQLPDGHVMEVGLAAESFVARAGDVLERGAVIVIDYGDGASALAARPAGTLVTYSDTGAGDDPLVRPGEQDITAHVNWTAVVGALRRRGLDTHGPLPQRDVLRHLGLAELDASLRSVHDAALARGDGAGAIRALSRRGGLGTLTDPGGLGGLGVVVGLKDVPAPAFVATR